MAQSGPSFADSEVEALWDVLQLMLAAGKAGREPTSAELSPSERWMQFTPESAVHSLPPRVTDLVSRCDWRRTSSVAESESAVAAVRETLTAHGRELDDEELRGALIATAFWLDPSGQTAFEDPVALQALEKFSGLVNGFAQSLPSHRVPGEHPDSQNRRFRAYQRRRYGYDNSTRTPQALVKRLPMAARELIESFEDRLIYGSVESARSLAITTAVAMGRPLDQTVSRQLEVALATAMLWREITELPSLPDSHVLLGNRPQDDPRRWDAAALVITEAMAFLRKPEGLATDPRKVQLPAQLPVAGVRLDADSLQSLCELDNYVCLFAAWLREGRGLDITPARRLALFDRAMNAGASTVDSGADVLARLTPQAMKVVASFNALLAGGSSADELTEDLATALGDRNLTKRYWRMLHTAASWLNGDVSPIERTRTVDVDLTNAKQQQASTREDLEPFLNATQRDAEALLDLGASVAELVRFSHSLTKGDRPPAGWWVKFHRRDLPSVPTPLALLERLPAGAEKLLQQHARVLASEHFGDLRQVPYALAPKLARLSEEHCARTLAVGLAAGVIWSDLERISRGRRTDSVLGAEPTNPKDMHLCARAQSQLEWGLQELLHSQAAMGA